MDGTAILIADGARTYDQYGNEIVATDEREVFVQARGVYRNEFYNRMAERGVMCNVHFKPLPMLLAYNNKGFDILDYPYAYNMHKNQLTLPMNSTMTDEEAEYVIETFKKVYDSMI